MSCWLAQTPSLSPAPSCSPAPPPCPCPLRPPLAIPRRLFLLCNSHWAALMGPGSPVSFISDSTAGTHTGLAQSCRHRAAISDPGMSGSSHPGTGPGTSSAPLPRPCRPPGGLLLIPHPAQVSPFTVQLKGYRSRFLQPAKTSSLVCLS